MAPPDIPMDRVWEALGRGPEADESESGEALFDRWLVSVTDVAGDIRLISPRLCESLGVSPDEVIGHNHRLFSSSLHSRPFFRRMWRTILAGNEWSGAIINRAITGAMRHYETTIRPIFSEERKIIGFVALRLELKLDDKTSGPSPALQHHVLEQLPEGVLIVDAQKSDEPIVYANAAWSRITGYHPDEALGRNARFLQGPGTNREVILQMIEALRQGTHFECEIVNYRKNGTPFWNHLSVSPVFDHNGQILNYISIVSDVTDSRASRLMLDLENNLLDQVARKVSGTEIFATLLERLNAFIPNDGAAVQVIDPSGTKLRLSAGHGLTPGLEEALHECPWGGGRMFPENAERRDGVTLISLAAEEEGASAFPSPDRRQAMTDEGIHSCWAVPSAGGGASMEAVLLLCFRTERKPTDRERDFLTMAANLVSMSIARGHSRQLRETVDRKLRQSQKMEAIGTLAGGIAHDFNNILGGVFGFLHLAVEDVGPDHPAQEWLQQIEGACKRARDLVQQVLVFSRSEEFTRVPLNPASVLKDAIKLVRASLPSSVEVEFHHPRNVIPEILGDHTQIQLAVLNLCTNAWQSMKSGRGRIDVRLGMVRSDDGAEDLLQISVQDTGEGIAPGTMERIFDPFYSTRPVGSGTGLGLSVVHGIMSSHEGQVVVESRIGHGSTFALQFPVFQETAEVPAGAPSRPARGTGERILFIDDEAAIVTWSRLILERMGYIVEAFTDPALALQELEERYDEFDLVLTDWTMPGLSGGDVIRKVHEQRPTMPIILTSGHGKLPSIEELRELGTALVLYKPISMEDLSDGLRQALHRNSEKAEG